MMDIVKTKLVEGVKIMSTEELTVENIIDLEARRYYCDEDSGEFLKMEDQIELLKLYEILDRSLTEDEWDKVVELAEEWYS